MKKKAIITGVTGQDGAYLAGLLLLKGYKVYGLQRRSAVGHTPNIDHLRGNPDFVLCYGDITDSSMIMRLLSEIQPDEVYNLAAQSHVGISFQIPEYTANIDGLGALRILEAIRSLGLKDKTRFYQASTSELYGNAKECPQTEETPFRPRSPYGVAKLFAYWTTVNYREAHGIYACNGILFNHESCIRGEEFVTRKIIQGLIKIRAGMQDCLYLGNLHAKRDWGHAADYCIDLDTKILTTQGFKKREELRISDTVINYNTKTNQWEYDSILKIHDVAHTGQMYHFKGNGVDFRCSQNHRIFYKRKTQKHKAWNDLSWQETTADQMYKLFYDKELRTKYDFCFPGFDGLGIEQKSGFEISDAYLRLLGYIVTEGNLRKSKVIGRGIVLSLSQSKKKYYTEIKETLQMLQLEYWERCREDDLVEFVFSSDSRDEILEYFESFDIHQLPSFVYQLSKHQLEVLYKAMMNADGCWANLQYISKRKSLIETFADIVSMIGYRSKLSMRKSGVYILQILSTARKSVNTFITEIYKEEVKENIWCVETYKNKSIITKRNDTVFVSGNCISMWMMLQQDTPDDFVIATGKQYSVKDFVYKTAQYLGIYIAWEDTGIMEKAFDKATGKTVVCVDQSLYRPSDVESLLGDATKARTTLGWEPKFSIEDLIQDMLWADIGDIVFTE